MPLLTSTSAALSVFSFCGTTVPSVARKKACAPITRATPLRLVSLFPGLEAAAAGLEPDGQVGLNE
jgi:hypothetical protein